MRLRGIPELARAGRSQRPEEQNDHHRCDLDASPSAHLLATSRPNIIAAHPTCYNANPDMETLPKRQGYSRIAPIIPGHE
jgi:hypothetical protein